MPYDYYQNKTREQFRQSLGGLREKVDELNKNKLLGESYDVWIDRLGISKDELNQMFGRLGKTLGTGQAQAFNLAGDASYNLPEATRLAQQRGIAQNYAQAYEQGTENIEQFAGIANRDAWAKVLSGDMSEEQFKAQMELEKAKLEAYENASNSQWWEKLLGDVGGAAASYLYKPVG